MTKPELSMYLGKKVIAVTRGDQPWEWGLKLQGDVEIRNKDERETHPPIGLVGAFFSSMTMSLQDTVMHFSTGEKFSFHPTKHTIFDPAYGSEVFPQWPEDLTLMGVHPEEADGPDALEAKDPAKWAERAAMLEEERVRRSAKESEEFLRDTEGDKK